MSPRQAVIDYEEIVIVLFVSLFACMIQFEICAIGIPVFSERCLGERFARSETVFTPESSSSTALFEPIPFIPVKSDMFSGF